MKNRTLPLVLILATWLLPMAMQAQTNQTPLIPSGNLSAFPTIVQAGTHPTLTWNVTLPESVDDV
jgi:hypothetical protein